MMAPVRLILASASPRRAELLRSAGLDFETFAVDVDESVRNGEAPDAYVRRLAMEKSARAEAVLMSGGAPAGLLALRSSTVRSQDALAVIQCS